MFKSIDRFLNGITMYRLVMYGLGLIASLAILLGFLNILPFSGPWLLISLGVLMLTCIVVNRLLSGVFHAPSNTESTPITALILFFILSPISSIHDLWLLVVASVLAILLKYLVTFHRKHLFNPAAGAAVILGLFGYGSAIWWVATPVLFIPVVLLGGCIVRKLRRSVLFFTFLVTSLASILMFGSWGTAPVWSSIPQIFLSWPLMFFGTIMLTEPLTTPPTKRLQAVYGGLVGVLSGLQFHLGPIYSTPEFALIIGNIFSFCVSLKQKLDLRLVEHRALSTDIHEFTFASKNPFTFQAGQYLEWTLPHPHADDRGMRRYFTIASSPTEEHVRLAIRVDTKRSSSFKTALLAMKPGDHLVAGSLAGDFVLPKDTHQKLVFIAGGIGVTPFRSMIQELIDKKESRDIALFYLAANPDCFAYKALLDTAHDQFGLKSIYVISPPKNDTPSNWTGRIGYITPQMLTEEVPDFHERTFYLSGPPGMVEAYTTLLKSSGIKSSNIKTDYFPGF